MQTDRAKVQKKVKIQPQDVDYDMGYERSLDRRNQTPNSILAKTSTGARHYFDNDSDLEEISKIQKYPKTIGKNLARKNKNSKNKYAVEQKQTFELTINLNDKKVENLKIFHSSKQRKKFKADQRRCSSGVNNQKFTK